MNRQILLAFLLLGLSCYQIFGQVDGGQTEGTSLSWGKGEQPLAYNLEHVLISFSPGISDEKLIEELEKAKRQQTFQEYRVIPGYGVVWLALNKEYSSWESLFSTVQPLLELTGLPVESYMPCFQGPEGEFASLSNWFIVGIEEGNSAPGIALLEELDAEASFEIVPCEWNQNAWKIKLKNSVPDAVEQLQNRLNGPGISFAYPDFYFSPLVTSNDTFYTYQWSLNNTGSGLQYNGTAGADIEIEQAWTITEGDSTIIIAVLDSGVDTLHPDLSGKLLPGYDATPQDLHGYPNTDYPQNAHGTACSGIVGANKDNSIGITGVAPGCMIMPVRVFYYVDIPGQGVQPFATSTVFAEGIEYAWQNGADVLSNSWGIPDWLLGLLPNQNLVEDAITHSYTLGRDSLGAPLLFSSGNEGDPPIWPGRLPNGITVNATSMCDEWKSSTSCDGENWWAGNWGGSLDISAPGVKIYTCDMTDTLGYGPGDYTSDFNGTSAACPHAAAVMALVLSERPDLTAEEARYVLSNSCEKVGGYDYSTVKWAGTWSEKLGYGRINAYQAVLAAQAFDSIPLVGILPVIDTDPDFEVYPNPAQQAITINWTQPTNAMTEWSLWDLSGRKIRMLNHQQYVPGKHQVSFSLEELGSGVYLLKGTGKGFSKFRKVVVQ